MSEIDIDKIIEISKNLEASESGGNKKCFFVEDYALLQGDFSEEEIKKVIKIQDELKNRGVNLAKTIDYRITEDSDKKYKKGYSLQEKAKGELLYDTNIRRNLRKDKQNTLNGYFNRLKSLNSEKQEFFDKFVQDWMEILKSGLKVDPSKPSNFFYEEGKNINFIDLDINDGKMRDAEYITMECTTVLAGNGIYFDIDGNERELAKSELSGIFQKLANALVKQGLNIESMKRIYPGIDFEEPIKTENSDAKEKSENQEEVKLDLNVQKKFASGLVKAYMKTEKEYQKEQRETYEEADKDRVLEILRTKGMNRNLFADLDGKWIGTPEDTDFKVEYSQKQVSAMARLLRAAQLLSADKVANSSGRDYFSELVAVPNIGYKLSQMQEDFKDSSSYIYELREEAKATKEVVVNSEENKKTEKIDVEKKLPVNIGNSFFGRFKRAFSVLRNKNDSRKFIDRLKDSINIMRNKVQYTDTEEEMKVDEDGGFVPKFNIDHQKALKDMQKNKEVSKDKQLTDDQKYF